MFADGEVKSSYAPSVRRMAPDGGSAGVAPPVDAVAVVVVGSVGVVDDELPEGIDVGGADELGDVTADVGDGGTVVVDDSDPPPHPTARATSASASETMPP